jgi:hypothetical protein
LLIKKKNVLFNFLSAIWGFLYFTKNQQIKNVKMYRKRKEEGL